MGTRSTENKPQQNYMDALTILASYEALPLSETVPGCPKEYVYAYEVRAVLAKAEARIASLEEALRFYAHPHQYGIGGGSVNNVIRDAGKIAKQALKETE